MENTPAEKDTTDQGQNNSSYLQTCPILSRERVDGNTNNALKHSDQVPDNRAESSMHLDRETGKENIDSSSNSSQGNSGQARRSMRRNQSPRKLIRARTVHLASADSLSTSEKCPQPPIKKARKSSANCPKGSTHAVSNPTSFPPILRTPQYPYPILNVLNNSLRNPSVAQSNLIPPVSTPPPRPPSLLPHPFPPRCYCRGFYSPSYMCPPPSPHPLPPSIPSSAQSQPLLNTIQYPYSVLRNPYDAQSNQIPVVSTPPPRPLSPFPPSPRRHCSSPSSPSPRPHPPHYPLPLSHPRPPLSMPPPTPTHPFLKTPPHPYLTPNVSEPTPRNPSVAQSNETPAVSTPPPPPSPLPSTSPPTPSHPLLKTLLYPYSVLNMPAPIQTNPCTSSSTPTPVPPVPPAAQPALLAAPDPIPAPSAPPPIKCRVCHERFWSPIALWLHTKDHHPTS